MTFSLYLFSSPFWFYNNTYIFTIFVLYLMISYFHSTKHKSLYRSLLLNNFHGGRTHREMYSTD